MLISGIDAKSAVLMSSNSIFWHHPFYSSFNNILRFSSFHCTIWDFSETANVASIVAVNFLRLFGASDNNFLTVNNNDTITGINMLAKVRPVLSLQNFCDFGSKAAKCFAGCV